MIVVDSSALIAILDEEHDAARYAEAIADADRPVMSPASLVEAGIVMLNRHAIQVGSVTAQQAQLFLETYASYARARRAKQG